MILLTTLISFLAVAGLTIGLYLALAPSRDFLQARLTQLWRPIIPESRTGPFSEKQKQKLERALTDLGKLLPSSEKKVSKKVRMMLRAGLPQSRSGKNPARP